MRNQKILYRLYARKFLKKKILPIIINNCTYLPPKKYTKSSAEKLKEKIKILEINDRDMPKRHGVS